MLLQMTVGGPASGQVTGMSTQHAHTCAVALSSCAEPLALGKGFKLDPKNVSSQDSVVPY